MDVGNLTRMVRLSQLTQAIGEKSFGEKLLQTARAAADVDQIMVFAFSALQSPLPILNTGSVETQVAQRAASRFSDALYLLDPNYQTIIRHREGPPIWFNNFDGGRTYCEELRSFVVDCGINDILSFVSSQNKTSYYVMCMRVGEGKFSDAHGWLLAQLGEMIAAHIHKHFRYMHTLKGEHQYLISSVLREADAFGNLTSRERLVCIGILTGHTSESIARNLSISVHSVVTYRRRVYEKLKISSQNELFVRVLSAMTTASNNADPDALRSNDILWPQETPSINHHDKLAYEMLLAEGLLG